MADADLTPLPTSRAEGKRLGSKRYFNSNPCRHGHAAERLTINGCCVECSRLKAVARYRADPGADLARQKAYRQANPERVREWQDKNRIVNPKLMERAADLALRNAAVGDGRSMYESSRACVKCHTTKRFSSGGKCVRCNNTLCSARYAKRNAHKAQQIAEKKELARERAEAAAARSKIAAAVSSARQTAIRDGQKLYTGRPCAAGHAGTRYALYGTCVACAAAQSASAEKKAYDKAYFEKHAERIRARTKAYHGKNQERYLASARAWAKANPEKRKVISRAYTHRRRAIEKEGDSTAALFAWEKAATKVCYWCGCKCQKRYHVDHYYPLSKGGKHAVGNLVIACPKCNLKKSAKDPLEFAAEVGRLF